MIEVVGIDPGPVASALVVLRDGKIYHAAMVPNTQLCDMLRHVRAKIVAIESMQSHGPRRIGKPFIDTCMAIGAFNEAWNRNCLLIPCPTVRRYICKNVASSESEIRAWLIRLMGEPGTKAAPGPTYGITDHLWSALAVAVYAHDHLESAEDRPVP